MRDTSSSNFAIVLGAAGFVGRHVCRELSSHGHRVVGIGHNSWGAVNWREWGLTDWIESDVSLKTLDQIYLPHLPSCVIHCAGSGAVSHSYTSPWEDFRRTTLTTADILEWVRKQPAPRARVVLVSSAAIYGDQGDMDAVENSVSAPISPYGFHKVAAENLCESASRFFEVPVSIVRLFSVYGEGLRKQLLWDALTKFGRGENRFFGTGHELRDWIHVDDAARLLCAAATESQSGFEIYNGANKQATTAEVLGRLAREIDFDGSPEFTGQTHAGNPKRLTADCTYARRVLSWTPIVPLDEGLRRYAAWFRSIAPLS